MACIPRNIGYSVEFTGAMDPMNHTNGNVETSKLTSYNVMNGTRTPLSQQYTAKQPNADQIQMAKNRYPAVNGPKSPTRKPEVKVATKKRRARPRHMSVPTSPPTQTRQESSDAKAPSRVGKYTIIRTLGRGNFAQVKLAVHVTTGREVAIKMIDKSTLNENCRIKLAREVQVLKSLVHPNIVRLYEVIETARHVYLVMEYARNGEVFDQLLKLGRMAEKQARSLFRQLFSAVEYCHQKNIVHRDLKAENLLLDENDNLKLADFGFANIFDSGCNLDTFCGSPPYAAPELLSGQKYHGPEVDVWALGVILYMLVCGQLPFEAYTLKDLHSRVMSGKYRIPFFISPECEAMLKKMLVLDPKCRAELKTLMNEEWINMGYDKEPLQPYKEPPMDYNDPIRRAIMNELGFHPDDVVDAFEKQRFNNVTATYLLLADTETRHRITKRLQSRNGLVEDSANRGAMTMMNGESGYTSENDDESDTATEATEANIDGHERSSSAFAQAGRGTDVMQPRSRKNWATGSLRHNERTEIMEVYLKQPKQMVRPALDFPQFSADADKSNIPAVTVPAATEPVKIVTSPKTNGLRRIRTSTLSVKPDDADNHSFRAPSPKACPIVIDNKVNTEPIARRTLYPEENQTTPTECARSRSIIIVSDIKQPGYELLKPATKPYRTASPYEPTTTRTNRVFEPLTLSAGYRPGRPSRMEMKFNSVAKPITSNARSYKSVSGAELLDESVYHQANDGKSRDSLSNARTSDVIIIEKENSPTRTTIISPRLAHKTPVRSSEQAANNHHVPVRQATLETTIMTQSNQAGRLPRWRRYTTETPVIIERPPDTKSNTVTKTLKINQPNQWIIKPDKKQGSLFSPPVQLRRAMMDGEKDSVKQTTFVRHTPASVPNSPQLNLSRSMTRTPSDDEASEANFEINDAQRSDKSGIRLHEPLTVTVVKPYAAQSETGRVRTGTGENRDGQGNRNSVAPAHIEHRQRQLTTWSRAPIYNDERRARAAYNRNSPSMMSPDINGKASGTWTINRRAKSPMKQTGRRTPLVTAQPDDRDAGSNVKTITLEHGIMEQIHLRNGEDNSWSVSTPTIAPRKQSWAFGIQIQGRNLQQLMANLLRILESKGIEYVYLSPYRLQCTYSSPMPITTGNRKSDKSVGSVIKWEVEIVQILRQKTYGMRFKHLAGENAQFRYLEKSITEQFPKLSQ